MKLNLIAAASCLVAASLVTAPAPVKIDNTSVKIVSAGPTLDDLGLEHRALERASRSAIRRALSAREEAAARLRQIARQAHLAHLAAIAASQRRAVAALTGSATAWARSSKAVAVSTCESSGDIHAVNGRYLGKWQMDADFWSTYGGLRFASSPLGATETEQDYVAWRGWLKRGWEPWTCAG